ncbi:MAG TPA: Amuc_1100 family pilus-like protein [Candidatus Udaeobacter sp.]|jgi:hypothetical protein|nr:Amuc_1100 family pilus-like protein [Candidatus Udaeobacter sp.]
MKWLQQNRVLGPFLIVSATCILVAAGLLYWRWSIWSEAKRTFDQAVAERIRLQRLDPFPDEANYRKLQSYVKEYTAALEKFKQQLKSEAVPELPLAPNEFQSRLRQATLATQDRARTNNVKLPDNFQLGFDEFARTMPGTTAAPLLGQELSEIQILINILLDAKVDSVTAFRRQSLPEEHGALVTPTPSSVRGRTVASGAKPGSTAAPMLIQRNIVDITFKAAPPAARKVLNEITSATEQFFIIRTLYVHNEKDKGPPRAKTANPTPTPASETNAGKPGASGPLNFIVGNEHIEVSASIEMLRFTF